ncbi:MAG: recombination protein RecR [Alistipes sp.]|nr:recombination protein RecR [Candidatus Minthomonas equi]
MNINGPDGIPALLGEAVEQFASLPGVGRRTALRLALHLLKQPRENVDRFGNAFIRLRNEIRYCECGMISDSEKCGVCSDPKRDSSVICVVESLRDVISIEQTGDYHGVYHVLGGLISPMDGVGPDDLPFGQLKTRVTFGKVSEVILALSTGMDGETTSFYISRILSETGVRITQIARGIGFGDDLEYADSFTLGKAIVNRIPIDISSR